MKPIQNIAPKPIVSSRFKSISHQFLRRKPKSPTAAARPQHGQTHSRRYSKIINYSKVAGKGKYPVFEETAILAKPYTNLLKPVR
jgi:hypothetical protein